MFVVVVLSLLFALVAQAVACALPPFVADVQCPTPDAAECVASCVFGYVTDLAGGTATLATCAGHGEWVLAAPCVPLACGGANLFPGCTCQMSNGDAVSLCNNCELLSCFKPAIQLTFMPAFPANVDIIRMINFNVHHSLPGLLPYPVVHYLAITRAGFTELVSFPNVSLPNLSGLDFSVNAITQIALDYFRSPALALIDEITLSRNPITILAAGIFDPLTKLKKLNIGGTIEVQMLLPFPVIANLTLLSRLEMSWATFAAMDHWDTLERFPLIETMFITWANKILDAAGLVEFAALLDRFLVSNSLQELSIVNSGLPRIPVWAGLKKLKSLYLDRNSIKLLPNASLPAFANLQNFSMLTNPSACKFDDNNSMVCSLCAEGFGGAPQFCEPQCVPLTQPSVILTGCTRESFGDSTCRLAGCASGYEPALASVLPASKSVTCLARNSQWLAQPGNKLVVDINTDVCQPRVCAICDCSRPQYLFCNNKSLSGPAYNFAAIPATITSVYVDNTKLRFIPRFNQSITNLSCAANNITDVLSDNFDALFGAFLLELNLSLNYISQLQPGCFKNLPNLLHLDLSGNFLSEIPVGVLGDLLKLQQFECKTKVHQGQTLFQFLTRLPADLPRTLNYFDFNNQHQLAPFFESEPNFFRNFSVLRTVQISGVRFSTSLNLAGVLPLSITSIASMQELACDACDLERLEPWSNPNNSVVAIQINANYISVISPFFFGSVPNLRSLAMSFNELNCVLDRLNFSVTCTGCNLATSTAGPGYCAPACDAAVKIPGATCAPKSVYGASCVAPCLTASGSKVSTRVVCPLNGSAYVVPGACTGTSLPVGSDSQSSSVIVGAAIGALCVILMIMAVIVAVLRRRRKRLEKTWVGVTQLENLLVEKVENTFVLAFAGRFKEDELGVARSEFSQLEIPRKCVKLTRLIGQGQGGEVHLATLTWPKGTLVDQRGHAGVPVAVKMQHGHAEQGKGLSDLRSGAFDTATEEALQLEVRRARLLHQLRHPYIVTVVAMVSHTLPTWVCLEYMANGDLKSYLRACRPMVRVPKEVVTEATIYSVLHQICEALAYLEEYHVVHRDIAARNVLVGDSLRLVKLSDLGATRVLDEQDYYRKRTVTHVPLKWMSPEAVLEARYTVKSDVWAFGVLAYEVTSFAMTPYGALGAQELMTELKSGYRLPQPPACPVPLYDIMMQCWQWDPVARPNFVGLLTRLAIAQRQRFEGGEMSGLPSPQSSRAASVVPRSARSSQQIDNDYSEQPAGPVVADTPDCHRDTSV